jgi:hypothetical protein
MHGDYTILKALSELFNGAKTAQIFLVNGRHKYMVLCYDADTDYNHAEYFMEQQKAEDFAEDWINDE